MAADRMVHRLEGGAVMAEWGPMRLSISSFLGKVPQQEMNLLAAQEAFRLLKSAARLKESLRRPWVNTLGPLRDPLGNAMLENVRSVGDPSLTPMAAVAGTIADGVADFLFSRGLTKVIVNNGGDIAVRITAPNSVRVGLREDVRSEAFSKVLSLTPAAGSARASFGVATSGLGGRSLTRGIASAATVIAETASMADAAATAVANASFVDAPGVFQCPAETVDPQTDIPGVAVTVRLTNLDSPTRAKGISISLALAEKLVEQGKILGAMVSVAGECGMTSFFETHST